MTVVNRKIIAVDIDDVLASINEAMRLFINKYYDAKHTPEEYQVDGQYWGYWEQIWNVSDDESKLRYEAFIRSDEFMQVAANEGAIDVINRLKRDYDLVVVTAREDFHIAGTHKWLDKQFGNTFQRVEFVPLWSTDRAFTKGEICKVIGAGYLIDDNIEHCNMAATENVQALLFGEYGWNRNKALHESVVRVKDWQEVAEYFSV